MPGQKRSPFCPQVITTWFWGTARTTVCFGKCLTETRASLRIVERVSVGRLLANVGLGDAELVDPLADDRHRPFEVARGQMMVLGRHRLLHDLEPALEVEAERRLLVQRRSRNPEQRDTAEREENQPDEDQVRPTVCHSKIACSLALAAFSVL